MGRRRLGIRARVVLSFVVLLAAAVVVSIVVLIQVGHRRIDEQADRDLSAAVDDLRATADRAGPTLGQPGGPTVAGLLQQYLQTRPVREDLTYLAFVDGRPFAASAGSKVALQDLDAAVLWARTTTGTRGEVSTPAGPARWVAVPVRSGTDTLGVVVAAQFLRDRQRALRSTVVTVSVVMVLVIAGACLLAWGAAGRALAPVRRLAGAARSVSTGTDLTARVEVDGNDEVADLSTSLNGMLTRLQEAFDGQRRFLDGAAHELRAPITIARGHLELLDEDPAEREATVALVLDELDRMDRLVEELRTLVRSGRPDFLEPTDVDLADLAAEIGRKAEGLAPRHWRVEAGRGPRVRADRRRLTQAVLNLVDNAVHVTGPDATIVIGARSDGDRAVIWVSDDGPGIASDDIPTLFEREGRTIRSRPGGTGLGLPLVAAIARAHGGSVSVSSEPGRGARFDISLPPKD